MDSKTLAALVASSEQILFSSKTFLSALSAKNTYDDDSSATATMVLISNYVYREEVVRPPHFFEEWVTNFTKLSFFSHFRMDHTTFEALLSQVGPIYKKERKKYHGGLQAIAIDKCLLITLWILAKGDTYISTADRFTTAPSTVHLIVTRMLDIICGLKEKFIKWPTQSEASSVERQFRSICGFPGVIGAIDGSHIMCKVPEIQHDSYQNRKCQHSIIMQGICSSDRLLINIFVGFPGRSNDSRVLQESPIHQQISEKGPEHLFYEDFHLIGDKAYAVQEWLMTPFKDNGNLSQAQKNYNISLSRSRVVIEHVFGMLKGRWRILIYVNAYSIERIVKIVGACSVLHNVCLLNNDNFDEIYTEEDEHQMEEPHEILLSGLQKRDLICNYLST